MEKKILELSCLSTKKFFVFDLDGVLINSTEMGFVKINQILSYLGLENVSEEFLRPHWGKRLSELYGLVCDEVGANDEQRQEVLDLEPIISADLPYEFSRELFESLTNLRLFGFYIGLITSRTDNSLKLIAKQVGLNLEIFDQLQTVNHFYHHKPDGRVFGPFINWAAARKISPIEMVYIGDTIENDYAATQDCDPKLDFIGVVSGATTGSEFLNAGIPPCRIVEFAHLPSFLHHIIRQKVEA
jgi:phosphoglycolate phosphatase-like HAD superfamily hydrolase